ncbi:MAG: signal transduction histidine kinase [Bacteroidetes bacterium]|nr:MAG: signal transduction histidine kinase [Bacteroidota bacterium]
MKKPVIILLHLGYWMVYLLLLLLFFGAFVPTMAPQNRELHLADAFVQWIKLMAGFAVVPGAIGFYVFYSFLFTKLLTRKKIVVFFAAAIATALGAAFAGMVILAVTGQHNVFSMEESEAVIPITLFISFIAMVNGIIGLVMRGFITWYGDLKLKEELNRKNFEMELALIKAQMNPHFLFNTINNIDVLIQKDSVKASMYLNQLSDMLRFMLYETKTEEIELAKEIAYVEKYIALQKIRTSNPGYIQYVLEGDPGNRLIAPMLFIPFIENAFKYAENKKSDKAIDIRIAIGKNTVTFECSNHYAAVNQVSPEQGGLGNELIRKRLELLYPGNHDLRISRSDTVYRVKLDIVQHEN